MAYSRQPIKHSHYDKRQILRAFNDHFIEFFEDIERVFPGNPDITTAKHAIVGFSKINPKILIKVFHESIGRIYRDELKRGNLQYFITKDYHNDVQNSKNADMLIQKINTLREPVNNMTSDDQNKVVRYMNNLIKLSDMYF
jgi:hypothetical protein